MKAGLLQGCKASSCSAAQQVHHLAAKHCGEPVPHRVECICSDQIYELHSSHATDSHFQVCSQGQLTAEGQVQQAGEGTKLG